MYHYLKQLIFPNKCIVCQTILEDRVIGHLCDKCYSFVLRHNLCPHCGRPYSIDDVHCAYCDKEEMDSNTQVVALFPYEDGFRKGVLRWKYKGLRKYAKGYADLFVNDLCIIDRFHIDALVPVPLSRARFRKRGFNQAQDLANEISKLAGVKVYDILTRVKETKPQSKCSKEERLSNIKGSIAVKPEINALEVKHIAVLDDIYTTGATIRECIHAIKRQNITGDSKIYVLIVCIGV
ncbi:ComF family protein [Cellulosilyticum sp. I15G10I2]|uniref:ComF family protein n=1 Tax=Cellulosilyticum sp. I15G10I2 TaxID=1892843 RepID=UPI00085BCB88|nr:ComF family protein [Cellulosilyticum sp. I15G10I2]